jgi:hypothetical protein
MMVALGTIYSKIMKAIKINSAVNLTSGLSIPSGSVCVIAEGYADVKSQKDGVIPAQIATFVFASVEALAQGKAPIQGIEDFNTTFSGLELSVVSYETISAEQLLIGAVYEALDKIYPSAVEVISI